MGNSGCCSLEVRERESCQFCGQRGIPVGERTLKSLLRDDILSEIKGGLNGFFFCRTSDCDVVYFRGRETFGKDALRVRVGIKEKFPPRPLCYCFGWTRERIERDFEEKGYSDVIREVSQLVKEGKCECEVKNPSGRCCLGDLKRVVRELGG